MIRQELEQKLETDQSTMRLVFRHPDCDLLRRPLVVALVKAEQSQTITNLDLQIFLLECKRRILLLTNTEHRERRIGVSRYEQAMT